MIYKKFTIEEKTDFARRYAEHTTLAQLAAEAGVSIPTMAKYVRSGGATVRPPGNPKNPLKGSKPGWPVPGTVPADIAVGTNPCAEIDVPDLLCNRVKAQESVVEPIRKIMSF